MDEHNMQQFKAIVEILRDTDPWLARISSDTPPKPIGKHSSLAGDDRITDPYQTSHIVWHSISHAVDHLNLLRTVLEKTGVIHMYAPFSLVRAALENAATAMWLLAPAKRPERAMRLCRWVARDIRDGDHAADLVVPAGNPRKPVSELLDRVRRIARQAGISETEALQPAVGYGKIVKAAGPTPEGERICEFAWRMCSANAHGDLWPTISIADKVELPGAPAGIAHMKVSANLVALQFATFVAVRTTARAWELYDQRRRNPC